MGRSVIGVFRTQLNVYDEDFCENISSKSYIVLNMSFLGIDLTKKFVCYICFFGNIRFQFDFDYRTPNQILFKQTPFTNHLTSLRNHQRIMVKLVFEYRVINAQNLLHNKLALFETLFTTFFFFDFTIKYILTVFFCDKHWVFSAKL